MESESNRECYDDENDTNDDGVEMLSLLHCDDDDTLDDSSQESKKIVGQSAHDSKPSKMIRAVIVALCGGFGVALLLLLSTHRSFFPKAFHRPTFDSKTRTSCDCFNPAAHCCDRTIFWTHKFGTILLGSMFLPNRQKDAEYRIHTLPTPKNLDYVLPTSLDYRHVLVTRNWFNAIVSGYLYHKAGYECTMDYKGNGTATQIQHHSKYFDLETHYHLQNWDTDLQVVINRISPRRNRSFCEYLAAESEEVGILMVMDFALSRWYKGVVPYYDKAQATMQHTHQHKSLFLCFEDLVDPFQQEDLFHRIAGFLFPGLNETQAWRLPGQMKASIENQKASHGSYEGGHASNHDPTMRDRLRRLVEHYDREIFNNKVASSNAVFQCG